MSLERIVSSLDAASVSTLLAVSSDVVLLLDRAGIIRDVQVANKDLAGDLENPAAWVDASLEACCTPDSKGRALTLVSQGATGVANRRIHLNHPTRTGTGLPVLYIAVPAGDSGMLIALGRDLRGVSVLQQRLVDAQQSLDRDYLRLRHLETRYRLLFEMTAEAVLVLDARSLRVIEANGPARALLGPAAELATSRSFHELFEPESAETVLSQLGLVRIAGRGEQISAKLAPHGVMITFSAWLFRQEEAGLILLRLHETHTNAARDMLTQDQTARLAALDRAPDGFVLTAESGRILSVNAAFLDMAQLSTADQAIGASLDQWLGRPGVDLSVLIANLRQRGSVRLFSTVLRGQFGASTDIEISAVGLAVSDDTFFAMTIRDVGRRLPAQSRAGQDIPRSVGQLTELIGRVPLKDLVRESTDMIERLCIEAALSLTGDNRASAAELLGLSRQSLYVKLRRYGLGELTDND